MAKKTDEMIDNGKLGLVLEGGGAKGAYQCGALKCLLEAGYDFDGITGTSIGAINGALILMGGLPKMQEFWRDVRVSKLFDISDDMMTGLMKMQFDAKMLSSYLTLLKNHRDVIKNSTQKIRNYFASYFDEKTLRDSPKDLGLVTYSLSTLKPYQKFKEDIPEGKLVDYLLASANCPPFGELKIDGEKYIDGVFYDNLPIKLITEKGYRNIIAIRTNTSKPRRMPKYKNLNVIFITPSQNIGEGMFFTEEQMEKSFKVGYFDAGRIAKDLRGSRYFISPFERLEFADAVGCCSAKFFSSLVQKKLKKKPSKRKFDNVTTMCAFVRDEMKLETIDQDEIWLTLFETFARVCRIERLKEYSCQTFVALVAKETVKLSQTNKNYDKLVKKKVGSDELAEMFLVLAKEISILFANEEVEEDLENESF